MKNWQTKFLANNMFLVLLLSTVISLHKTSNPFFTSSSYNDDKQYEYSTVKIDDIFSRESGKTEAIDTSIQALETHPNDQKIAQIIQNINRSMKNDQDFIFDDKFIKALKKMSINFVNADMLSMMSWSSTFFLELINAYQKIIKDKYSTSVTTLDNMEKFYISQQSDETVIFNHKINFYDMLLKKITAKKGQENFADIRHTLVCSEFCHDKEDGSTVHESAREKWQSESSALNRRIYEEYAPYKILHKHFLNKINNKDPVIKKIIQIINIKIDILANNLLKKVMDTAQQAHHYGVSVGLINPAHPEHRTQIYAHPQTLCIYFAGTLYPSFRNNNTDYSTRESLNKFAKDNNIPDKIMKKLIAYYFYENKTIETITQDEINTFDKIIIKYIEDHQELNDMVMEITSKILPDTSKIEEITAAQKAAHKKKKRHTAIVTVVLGVGVLTPVFLLSSGEGKKIKSTQSQFLIGEAAAPAPAL